MGRFAEDGAPRHRGSARRSLLNASASIYAAAGNRLKTRATGSRQNPGTRMRNTLVEIGPDALTAAGGRTRPVRLALFLLAALFASAVPADDAREKSSAARAFLSSVERDASLQRFLDQTVDRLLARDARARGARLGIALVDLKPGRAPRLAHRNGDTPIYPASVVKFVYLMAAYAWMEQGKLRIDDGMDRQLTDMIYQSSNLATQKVFRTLTRTEAGPALTGDEYEAFRERRIAVKRWLESLGVTGVHSIHPTYNGGGDLFGRDVQLLRDPTVKGGISNASGSFVNRQAMSANGTAGLLALLASDLALSPNNAARVRERMKRDPAKQPYQKHRIAGGALRTAGVEVYSKTGTWGPIFADAGIIRGPSGRQLVLVVFIESNPAYRGGFIAELAAACTSELLDEAR